MQALDPLAFLEPEGGHEVKAVVDIYLRLRAEGMIARQLHTDCAGEFRSAALAEWCMQMAILHTYTSGDQPQANGRAEQSVGEVK